MFECVYKMFGLRYDKLTLYFSYRANNINSVFIDANHSKV